MCDIDFVGSSEHEGCKQEPAFVLLIGLTRSFIVHRCVMYVDSYSRIFLSSEEKMKKFATHVIEFLQNEDGPTAVEYAIMLALIVIVCLASITAIGNNANAKFTEISDTLS